ncbi:MAG: hypothetical protein PHV02_18090 [Rhodocyclaceae bacterium]|nr:hypothetical protein [Rhodocyclaceae bacterium]
MTPEQHKEIMFLAQDSYAEIRRKMSTKSATGGFDALVVAFTSVYETGLRHALDSEGKAWKKVNDLEDLLIAVLRHAPGGDLAIAKGEVAHLVPELFDIEPRSS